jgi:hypothetical protein
LTVNGTTTTTDTNELHVTDPLIKLAKDNTANSLDIGFYGQYRASGSTNQFTGLFRDQNDSGKYKLFELLEVEPTTTVNTGGTGYQTATLVANLEGNVVGNLTGTIQTAAQGNITSLGTLTALQVDNININGNTISSTAGTDLNITPLAGQQIVLDGAIVIDAGVVTGATSITSTAFVGALTGNASTATTLETARTIGGVSFNGSANIDLAGVNTTGNQDTTGNAATATALATSRTIALSGDVVGSASFDGTGNATLSTTIQANSVALGTDTTGDYVESLVAGTGVTLSNNSGEGATPTVAIGQAVATSSDVTFNTVTADVIGNINGATEFTAQAGEALTKGDAVYISGISGNTPIVSKADADVTSKMPSFGLAKADANLNASVVVITFGTLSGLNTSSFSAGDILFISTTAGGLTATAPTGESSLLQNIGIVQRSHASAGSIKVGGAGRTNATPNLNNGKIFLGNGSNQSVSTTLDSSIVPENTNLYYTDARANSAIDARVTNTFINNLSGVVADTATALATARNIGGTSFDGTANIDIAEINVIANNTTNETVYLTFVDGATGVQGLETDTGLNYNPSTGMLTSTGFTGALTGNASTATTLETARTIGGTSFDGSANISIALADTATALATARTIGGVSFDGTANINLAGVNTTGNQDTSGNAATATILETARTINGVSFDGSANVTTLTAGTGVSVSGTAVSIGQAVATSDSPTFANLTLGGTDSIKVPAGTTGQRNGSPVNGMFRYNSSNAEFEGYQNGAWGAIAGGGAAAMETSNHTGDGSTRAFSVSTNVVNEDNLVCFIDGVYQNKDTFVASGTTVTFDTAPANTRKIVIYHVRSAVAGSSIVQDSFTGNGSTTDYTLSINPTSELNTQVYIDGVYQNKSTYTVSGTTLAFDTAPINTTSIEVIIMSQTAVNAPTSNSVTTSTIVDGNVTTAKILDANVTTAKIADSAITSAKIADGTIATGDIADDAITSAKLDTNIDIAGTLTVTGEITANGGIALGNDDIATFGNSDELKIYYDGNVAWFDNQDSVTKDTQIKVADGGYITLKAGTDTMIQAAGNSNVSLYHNGSPKLATTSTGIDVTGTATMDGLTVDGASDLNGNVTIGTSLTTLLTGNDIEFQRAGDSYLSQTGGGSLFIRTNDGVSNKVRVNVSPIGDISFYEDTGTTAKFFWDASAESLGIGTTSPAYGLDLLGATNYKTVRIGQVTATGTKRQAIAARHYTSSEQDHNMIGMFTDSNTNSILSIGGGLGSTGDFNSVTQIQLHTGNGTTTNTTAAVTIDASGNLLVGKTSTAFGTAGVRAVFNGQLQATADGNEPLGLNRLSSDGSLIDFYKDTSTVGSIGTLSGLLGIGNGDAGLLMAGSVDAVAPYNASTNATRDAAIDLGTATNRFKDLYLSGGAYLGGTGSANKLDDYEEGTFTIAFENSGTNPTVNTVSNTTAYYTKIGNTVRFMFYSGTIDIGNIGTGSARLTGLPFNSVGGTYSYSPVTFAHTTAFDSGPTGYTVTGSTYIQCTDALPATAGCQYVTGTNFIMVSGVYQTA